MFVEIDRTDRTLLIELVEGRLRELGPEIRRCANSGYQQTLQDKKGALQHILHRLHEAEWDVTC